MNYSKLSTKLIADLVDAELDKNGQLDSMPFSVFVQLHETPNEEVRERLKQYGVTSSSSDKKNYTANLSFNQIRDLSECDWVKAIEGAVLLRTCSL